MMDNIVHSIQSKISYTNAASNSTDASAMAIDNS